MDNNFTNKLMKQTIKKSIITIVMIAIGAISNHALALTYTDIDDINLTCILTSSSSTKYSGDIVIPEKVKFASRGDVYYTVIGIDELAFSGCTGLTSVTIPNSVTSIGSRAFKGCTGLTSITIPNSITKINYDAFEGCTNLKKLAIEDGKKTLSLDDYNQKAFKDCPIEELYLGRNITEPRHYAYGTFYNKSSLHKLIIGDSVTKINYSGFSGCENLASLTLGNSLITIGSRSFSGCDKLTSIVIPNSLTSIDESAFYNCESLKSAIIGNGITDLPSSLFKSCDSLTTIYLGNSIKKIYDECFDLCPNLTNIYLFSDNVTTLGTDAIPTTVSRIYVPNTERYENLLSGYYTENLITLNESTTEYNGKVPEFNYKNNVEGMNVSFNDSTTFIEAGNYNTNVDVIFSNDVWSTQIKIPCSYTITKAPVTIIANDAKRQYREENPEFSCSYFGFKNGETDSVLITKPTIATTATINSSVGSYPIIPTNADAKNYTFTYERGNLTITQASQIINWNQSFEEVFVGDQIELTAEATSGLAVKFSVSNESIAEIYTSNGKTYLDCIKDGEVTLKANQSGNDNYLAADRVSKTIVIKKISRINDVKSDNNAEEVARYDIYGRRLSKPTKGMNIVIYSDGSAKKVTEKE